MKTKKFFNLCACVLLLGGLAMLTSCVYDSDEAVAGKTSEDGKLVINITPTEVGGTTRAVTELTTDQSTNELWVQNMVVGVFKAAADGDGAVVTLQSYTVNASASTGFSRLANIEGATTHFAADDHVLVAVNVPASVVTKLTNKTNISTRKKFLSVFDGSTGYGITIDQVLTQKDDYSDPTQNIVQANYLPMFGEATISQAKKTDTTTDMADSYVANISLVHMVSKITLNSVTFNTVGNGSANADDKLELKEVFLVNVPTKLDFAFSAYPTVAGTAFTGGYAFDRQDANCYQGWTADATADATNLDADNDNNLDADKAYRNYLGTGAVSDETVGGVLTGNKMNHSYVLYTMPNDNTTAVTKLVIKAALNGTDYYYPLELRNSENNTLSTDAKIYPNRNYMVDVIIKGVGAATPFAEIGTQQTTQANITVKAWTAATNTTTFNHNGGDPDVQ